MEIFSAMVPQPRSFSSQVSSVVIGGGIIYGAIYALKVNNMSHSLDALLHYFSLFCFMQYSVLTSVLKRQMS